MTPKEFQELRSNPHPIFAASVKVLAPTGEYDADKLINIGTNRWGVKPELGYMIPLKPRWLLELELGVWFFNDNHDFMGMTREQDPIVAGEIHLVRRLRPGRWISLEFNYYEGGRTTIDGEARDDLLRNSRLGGTFAWSLGGRHAIKVSVSAGVITGYGGDYYTALAGYSVRLR
jgi:hypothetical protein